MKAEFYRFLGSDGHVLHPPKPEIAGASHGDRLRIWDVNAGRNLVAERAGEQDRVRGERARERRRN